MATKRTTSTRKPEVEPIFLSMYQRIEISTNVLTDKGSYDEAIRTLEIREKLQPQEDEIKALHMQELKPGAWAWNEKLEQGQKRAFRFSKEWMDHIKKCYELKALRGQLDLSPVSLDLMFLFVPRAEFMKKAKARKTNA